MLARADLRLSEPRESLSDIVFSCFEASVDAPSDSRVHLLHLARRTTPPVFSERTQAKLRAKQGTRERPARFRTGRAGTKVALAKAEVRAGTPVAAVATLAVVGLMVGVSRIVITIVWKRIRTVHRISPHGFGKGLRRGVHKAYHARNRPL